MNTHELCDTLKLKQKYIVNHTPDEEKDLTTIEKIFLNVVEKIDDNNYVFARELLMQAASEDIENPEMYNLLGISYEKEGDRAKAAKYYRVAYYMNQSFTAAKRNLERVSEHYYKGSNTVDWGIKIKEDNKC